MLYAAMNMTQSDAPKGHCWKRQVEVPLSWILAFLKSNVGDLTRTIHLDTYTRKGPRVVITTDASPFGVGAILQVNGQIIEYLADQILDTDKQVLGLDDCQGSRNQQVLEALAMLIALRSWAHHWKCNRVVLTVKTDNVATLALVARMQPHSAQLGVIAREMALDMAQACYSPDVVEHLPGVANTGADALSRLHAPSQHKLPTYLCTVPRCTLSVCGHSWWRSLPAPLKCGVGRKTNNIQY